jgi:tetratricopeptide (TPR) repeat protein
LYEEAKEFEKAEKILKRGLELDSKDTRLHFRLGVVYDKWGRKTDSIKSMENVIRLDPQNANALNYLGYTYADLGQNLDEAEQLIKTALKYKPDDGYITDSLGWVYFKKGLFKKALAILQKAVNLVPDDPVILEHLGDTYLKISNKEKALEFYKRSLMYKKEDKSVLEKKIQELTEDGS